MGHLDRILLIYDSEKNLKKYSSDRICLTKDVCAAAGIIFAEEVFILDFFPWFLVHDDLCVGQSNVWHSLQQYETFLHAPQLLNGGLFNRGCSLQFPQLLSDSADIVLISFRNYLDFVLFMKVLCNGS